MGGRVRRDPRWVLAMVSLVCAIAIQAYLIYLGKGDEMPAWIVAVVTAAMSYYFGARNGKNPHPSEFVGTDQKPPPMPPTDGR